MEYLKTYSSCSHPRQSPDEITKTIEYNKAAMEHHRLEWEAPEQITEEELDFI